MSKGKKIALAVVSAIIAIILIVIGVLAMVSELKYDYNFQRLSVSVDDSCYMYDVEYTESTRILNATANVKIKIVNRTNKEIGIDTNIINLCFYEPDGVIYRDNGYWSKDTQVANKHMHEVCLGDFLENNQYLTINEKDIKYVNVSIPISLIFETSPTELELRTKLNSLQVGCVSTYFHESYFNMEMRNFKR